MYLSAYEALDVTFQENAVHIHMLDQTQISDHTYNNKTDVYWPLLTGRHNILDTEQTL